MHRNEKINTWLATVEQFLEMNNVATADGEVKVALIDDGVDFRRFKDNIYTDGWPRASSTSDDDLWFKSTNEHGTRMAELILKVCPRAQIYVAKLVDWRDTQHKDHLGTAETAKSAAEVSLNWLDCKAYHLHLKMTK
jgi:hypothetical protein